MNDNRTALRVAQPSEREQSPAAARPVIARVLRAVADVAESGEEWVISGNERAPMCAVMLVTFGPDGEPTPMIVGISGDNWNDHRLYSGLVNDAADALRSMRRTFVTFAGQTSGGPEPDPYAASMEHWLQQEEMRERHRKAQAQKQADHIASHPFLCDCKRRFKSKGGMTNHRNRSWTHRNDVAG